MQKNKKIIWGTVSVILIVIGGISVWKYFKASAQKKQAEVPDSLPESQASKPVKASSPSLFPLKQGSSKNDLVKQLQGYLGVLADGVWGAKTQSAFVSQTGKTQISNQAEFDQVISMLKAQAAAKSDASRADDLTKKWRANTNLQLMAGPNRAYYFGVTKDAYGALPLNNDNGSYAPNVKISRSDAQPLGSTTSGYLLFQNANGKLYKVSSNLMTIG